MSDLTPQIPKDGQRPSVKQKKKKKQPAGIKRRVVAPGTALLTWKGPTHKTVFIQRPLDSDELMLQAQRLAVELGPDHPRVRMLKKQINDLLRTGKTSA